MTNDWVARVRAHQSAFHSTQHQMTNHNLTSHERGVTCLTFNIAGHNLLVDGARHIQAIGV